MKKTSRLNKLLCTGILLLCIQLLIIGPIWGNNLYGQQHKMISVNLKDVTLLYALEYLTNVMGCEILYNHEQIKSDKKLSLEMNNKPLEEVLKKCLENTNLTYKIVDDVFVLTHRVTDEQKAKELSGVVVDVKGDSIPGVTVMIKGTSIGVSTDTKGMFKIKLPANLKDITLVFSFVGMETQEVKVGAKTTFRVVLLEKKENLNEVVITGYANIKKSSFTGNSVSVSREQLMKVSNRNIISALQTFDPSFRIKENNTWGSDPNALPEFSIRGNSSLGIGDVERVSGMSKAELRNNSNLPIFIMDGFEVTVEKVYDFDVNRIENITILKDAAATALYGSRAANGVVVITTVAPKPGQLQVSYNFSGDLTSPDLSDYNLMNAKEKLEAEVLGGFYDEDGPLEQNEKYNEKLNNINKGVDTYWISQPVETVFNHKHSLYAEGGNEALRFGVDLNYDSQKGVMKKSYRNRMGVGIALDFRIKKFKIKNYTSYNIMKSKESPYGNFSDYTSKLPYDEMKDEFGNYLKNTKEWENQTLHTENPLYEAGLHSYDISSYRELLNNLSINWFIHESILLKAEFSVTQRIGDSERFVDPNSRQFDGSGDGFHNDLKSKGELHQNNNEDVNWNLNVVASYNNTIAKHNMNFSIGLNAMNKNYNAESKSYRGFPNGMLNKPSYAYEIITKPTTSESASRLFSSFLMLNYTYNDIYLADVSVRFDGSSEFGSDKRFAPFWSGGLGINIHNYEFMKNQSIIDLLKIRGSYGQLGKGNFPPFAAVSTYQSYSKDWYSTGYGAILTYLGNPNLKWEKTNEMDIGFELQILKGLFYLKTSFYKKKTIDLITSVTIPSNSGFTSYYDNMGEIMNKGFELDFRSNIINTADAQLTLWGNLGHNKETILKISDNIAAYNQKIQDYYNNLSDNDQAGAEIITQYVPGGSTTSIFAMRSLGIDPANGKDMFLKKDGTITYDWDPREQVIVGNKEPDASGNFGLNATYKNFSLFTSFSYEFGGQAYNSTLVNQVENVDFLRYNADKRVLTDRWQKPGDIAMLKDIKDSNITTRPTSRFVQNYNVLSLSALTFGYDFDRETISKIGLSMLRLNLNMNDICRWSTVKQERGLSYPFARTYSISLNATF